MRLLDLAVRQPEASGDGADMGDRPLQRARPDHEQLLAQANQHLGHVHPADTVRHEDARDAGFTHAALLLQILRHARPLPQLEMARMLLIGLRLQADAPAPGY